MKNNPNTKSTKKTRSVRNEFLQEQSKNLGVNIYTGMEISALQQVKTGKNNMK